MKNSNDTIGNRSRDLPVCSAVPQTQRHLATRQWVRGLFAGGKRPGRGANHPPRFSAGVKERVQLYFCSSSGPSWPVTGLNLLLTLQVTVELRCSQPRVTDMESDHVSLKMTAYSCDP
jgi:hypothetical protein